MGPVKRYSGTGSPDIVLHSPARIRMFNMLKRGPYADRGGGCGLRSSDHTSLRRLMLYDSEVRLSASKRPTYSS